jgi:peptidoglycan-associated lipoprotein
LEATRAKFVSENVYFDFDDASLSQQARQVLMEKAAWLRTNSDSRVIIEGHCDERGTAEYNIALGQRRAQSIKTFLVNAGIDPSRLRTVSYGEERPLDPGKTEEAYARNRRGQFRIDN